jgi:hypothetical protein
MATPEFDKVLAAALTAAKSASHGFAVVAKGSAVVHLLVSKTPIKDADVQKAKKEHGGTAVIRGKCQGHDGELVFHVSKAPAIDAKKLKEYITHASNLSIKPRFEVVAEASLEGDEASETEAEQAGAGKAAGLEGDKAPPAGTGDAASFTTRLKALRTDLDMVRGAETSVTAAVKTLAAEVAALAGKKQFAEATEVLNRIEPLVKKGKAELSAHAGPRAVAGSHAGDAGSGDSRAAAVKAALTDWQTARGAAIAKLQELANAIKGYDHPESGQAFAKCRAVQSNLTAKPETLQSVSELEEYLDSDQVVATVEEPNGFGITVALRKPLLDALSKLKALLSA